MLDCVNRLFRRAKVDSEEEAYKCDFLLSLHQTSFEARSIGTLQPSPLLQLLDGLYRLWLHFDLITNHIIKS